MRYILIAILFISCNSAPQTKAEVHAQDTAALQAMMLERAKPAYMKAYTEVNSIRLYIKLADKGTLSKQDVLGEYNQSLGETMGQMNSFAGMKQRIDTAGDDYIKMKWYQEAARLALEAAGESSFKTE